MFRCHVVASLGRGGVVKMDMHTWTRGLVSVCMTSNCGASLVLFCIAFAIHLSVILATHTLSLSLTHRPCIQASLTLNLAQADSNFCLQITFQWLHKSAASSSASFSFSPSSSLCFSIFPSSPPPLSLPFYSSLTSFFLYKPPPSSFPLCLCFTISLPPLVSSSFPHHLFFLVSAHTPFLCRSLSK